MTSEGSSSIMSILSRTVGASEPALRLLLSIIIGYPLAFIYRKFISQQPKFICHLFVIFCGISICLFNYGYELYHSLITIIATYLLIKVFRGTQYLSTSCLIFHMSYLLIGYYYTGTETYDIKWTMPHCVLVLRLIGLAFDIADGEVPEAELSSENKKAAIKNAPNLFEIASYTYFPASFMVGPQFPFKRYEQFMNKEFDKYTGAVQAGLKRAGLGVFYLIVYQVGSMYYSDSYILSEDFSNSWLFYKLFAIGMWGKFTLYKYISCWLLSEGVATCFGLTFVKVNEDKSEDWSGVTNVKLKTFENALKLHHYIEAFNVNTNHWVAQYVYKRLKFLGNRTYSHICTLLFLAVWHGFHSGYYVCFFMEFIVVVFEREVTSIVNKNEKFVNFMNQPMVRPLVFVGMKFYSIVYMGWSLIPFVFLNYTKYWPVYSSLYFIGLVLLLPWPFVYKPILKLIMLPPRDKPESKKTE